jgi:hypothetical protein
MAPISILFFLFLISQALAPDRVRADSSEKSNTLEYKVKAAYLLNFTRYVGWPAGTFESADTPIRICVMGEDPFGELLDLAARGQSVRYRRVDLKRVTRQGEESNCHLAFVGGVDSGDGIEWCKRLSRLPILIVTDSLEVFQDGAHILLHRYEDTIRFSVNLRLSKAAGLTISSRMLALAKDIRSALSAGLRRYA